MADPGDIAVREVDREPEPIHSGLAQLPPALNRLVEQVAGIVAPAKDAPVTLSPSDPRGRGTAGGCEDGDAPAKVTAVFGCPSLGDQQVGDRVLALPL